MLVSRDPIKEATSRIQQDLEYIIEASNDQSREEEMIIKHLNEDLEMSLETNSLMVQQLKANQEDILKLRTKVEDGIGELQRIEEETVKLKIDLANKESELNIANGKVMGLTVQITELGQQLQKLADESKAQLTAKQQQMEIEQKLFKEQLEFTKQEFQEQLKVKDAQIKNMERAQGEFNKLRRP